MKNISEPNLPGHHTAEGFVKICRDALDEQEKHEHLAKHCKKWKNYHSFSVLFSGLFASSVLFASMADLAPKTMRWVGAFLALYSASCSGINSYCRYPEREGAHTQASTRFKSFAASCNVQIAKYKDRSIDVAQFQALLNQHLEDYQDLVTSSPPTEK